MNQIHMNLSLSLLWTALTLIALPQTAAAQKTGGDRVRVEVPAPAGSGEQDPKSGSKPTQKPDVGSLNAVVKPVGGDEPSTGGDLVEPRAAQPVPKSARPAQAGDQPAGGYTVATVPPHAGRGGLPSGTAGADGRIPQPRSDETYVDLRRPLTVRETEFVQGYSAPLPRSIAPVEPAGEQPPAAGK